MPPSACAAASSVSRSATPNAPGIAPAERMWRVRRRVSIPAMPGDAVPFEIAAQVFGRAPARRPAREIADDHAAAAGSARFVVVAVDAVVADVRIRERDDLPRVRRVGDDLLVADERGVEHDLARDHPRLGPMTRRRNPRTSSRRPAPTTPSYPQPPPQPDAHVMARSDRVGALDVDQSDWCDASLGGLAVSDGGVAGEDACGGPCR